MATRLILVVTFAWKTPLFGDETSSRHLFEPENAHFWRRDLFSSSFWGKKLTFLATRLFLVVTFARETPLFSDETSSRHLFEPENAHFWRRDLFSSSFWGKKLTFLATRLFLVVTFGRETPLFGDETPFSSSLLHGKLHFLATKLFLVVTFARETPLFSDETSSRHLFEPENAHFWRRDSFSSPLWGKKLTFLATRLFLVVTFARETPLFSDETLSRHLFEPENATFWRRDHFSSPFLGENLVFLAMRRQDEMPNLASINRKLAHIKSHILHK
ncbi:hypothetical protein NST17_18990 [Caldifermentibacillus hisashii]|uniref:Secreted protein n=1 Tax=Caldifermentibacillus hisashii TaxID=996558 RepID=A0ABU9K2E5_9BACI